jgi:hypothetical protein
MSDFPSKTELKLGLLILRTCSESKINKSSEDFFLAGMIPREDILSYLELTEPAAHTILSEFENRCLLTPISVYGDGRKKTYGVTIKGYEFAKCCEELTRLYDNNLAFFDYRQQITTRELSKARKIKDAIKTDFRKLGDEIK